MKKLQEVDGYHIYTRFIENYASQPYPPLVLIPGLCLSGWYMEPLMRALARTYRVFTLEFPGFGKSSKPPSALDVPEMADCLASWMGTNKINSAVVLGHSFGCQPVSEFAVRYPEKTFRVILCGPTYDPKTRSLPVLLTKWMINPPAETFIQSLIYSHDFFKGGLGRFGKTFQYSYADAVEENVKEIQFPLLLVRGSRDRIVSHEWLVTLSQMAPNAQIATVSNGAHTINYTAPAKLAAEIKHFLSGANSTASTHKARRLDYAKK